MAGIKVPREGLLRIIVIIGGALVFLQAFIHSFLGYSSVVDISTKNSARILLWAWFGVGIALASLSLLAVYFGSWLARGKRWALIAEVSIGVTILLILIPAAVIGIGYPVIGIIGGLLLLAPLLWAGRFEKHRK